MQIDVAQAPAKVSRRVQFVHQTKLRKMSPGSITVTALPVERPLEDLESHSMFSTTPRCDLATQGHFLEPRAPAQKGVHFGANPSARRHHCCVRIVPDQVVTKVPNASLGCAEHAAIVTPDRLVDLLACCQ
jgi:hypothetical protein